MKVRAFLHVSLLVSAGACGGSVAPLPEPPQEQAQVELTAPANFHGGRCDPPESICQADGVASRGSYVCPSGGLAYYCCGYAEGDLRFLAKQGDVYASHCTDRYTASSDRNLAH